MGLVRHRGVLRDSAGNGVNTATVTVTVSASGAAASLYTDKDGVYPTVGNVVLTDEVGRFWFYLAEGTYDLTYTKAGVALGSDVDVPVVDPMLFEEVSLKKFNLQSSGNNTTAIQAALDAAAADYLCLVVPPGIWEATQLLISGNMRIRGHEPRFSAFKQRASTNANFIIVAHTVVQNPIIENLTIDGNRLNNSAGDALHIEDHAEPDATVTYGFSVVLRNSYVQNAAGLCMYIGANRNMGHIENTEFKRGATGLMTMDEASDWRFDSGRFGFPISGSAVIVGNGADNVFEKCSAFGAIDAPCVQFNGTSSSPTKWLGGTINYNQREGLRIQGPSGIARAIPHQIANTWFAENGLATDNTYSHIKCTDVAAVILSGNSFRYSGTGNKVKYLLETSGVVGHMQWVANSWDQTSAPYGTAISNTPELLRARLEALAVEGTTYLGAATNDLTANSLRVPQGVSGGNYVQVQGRASGTGPDVTAQGVDPTSALRLSAKGGSAVEVWTNSLASRVARFMPITSAVNRLDIYPGATTNAVRLVAAGEANINLSLEPAGTTGCISVPTDGLRNYADDAAAASGGVPVRGLYHTSGAVKIRLA
ncbi:MAG: hypothetical protein QG602_1222 [Verrucomicrobiota bacterium]|nr:hypothetical protein [Verrucomicrobiota bacterium]